MAVDGYFEKTGTGDWSRLDTSATAPAFTTAAVASWRVDHEQSADGGADSAIISVWNTGTDLQYMVSIGNGGSAGKVRFGYSFDGTANTTQTGPTGNGAGTREQIRVDLDQNTGDLDIYVTTGKTTQAALKLDTGWGTASSYTITASDLHTPTTNKIDVMGKGGGGSPQYDGKVYGVAVKDASTWIVDADFRTDGTPSWGSGSNVTDDASVVWTTEGQDAAFFYTDPIPDQAVALNVLTVTPTFNNMAVALGAAPGGGVEERQMMMGM